MVTIDCNKESSATLLPHFRLLIGRKRSEWFRPVAAAAAAAAAVSFASSNRGKKMSLFRNAVHRRETYDRIAAGLGPEIAGKVILFLDFVVTLGPEDLDNYILRAMLRQTVQTTGAVAAEITLDIFTYYLLNTGQI